jgi:DNA polymerase I-like protein with 3'-5' exonuclease and polymerase domains
MFPPPCDWKIPSMSDLPQSWAGARRVAIDTETHNPDIREYGIAVRRGGRMVGVSFAIEGGPKHYLPIRHEGGDNMDVDQVLSYLRYQAKVFDGDLVGANLGYDMDWLLEEDIDFRPRFWRDIQIAEPLLDEHKFSYSLNNIAKEWIGEQKEDELMLEAAQAYGMGKRDKLGEWIHRLPGRYVGAYAESDVDLPLRIIKLQEDEIARQGLQEVYDLESRVLPILVRMRRRGVKVDLNRLQEVDTRAAREVNTACKLIREETGLHFGPEDINKKVELAKIIRATGMEIDASDTMDKAFIAANSNNKVIAAIGEARKWEKVRSTFVASVQDHQVNGRIHCTFNQLRRNREDNKGLKGAAYGRLSCEKPNLQQQPARDEDIAPIWRRIYMPDDGGLWAACDYSQQEPRMLTHYAELCGLFGAAAAGDKYRSDPDMDNHDMMTELVYGITRADVDRATFEQKRKYCKVIMLGVCYGMGQKKLCRDLGLPTKIITLRSGKRIEVAGDEGSKIMDTFHAKLPYVNKLSETCEERARERGFITTLSGRKCRFPRTSDGLNYDWTHKALNRLIQGSSADQTKMAMVAADEAGFDLQLQVHDEIDLTVSSPEEARELAEIMENCVELRVPSKVDVEIGPSWGEAK